MRLQVPPTELDSIARALFECVFGESTALAETEAITVLLIDMGVNFEDLWPILEEKLSGATYSRLYPQ